MLPETYKRLSELFAEGSELGKEERAAFLQRCEQHEPELRDQLVRLFSCDSVDGLSAPDEIEPCVDGDLVTHQRHRPVIPGYRIESLVGEGGMGQVWCAIQESTRREVALKVIHGIRLYSRRTRARFEREVELSARLAHPNIARIYDSGVADDCAYYAMELVRGQPLQDYVQEAHLSETEKVELMLRICRAVQHAHQRGVIHRDLKPSNVLVTQDRRPVLVDFGLAKSLVHEEVDGELLTQEVIIGTPAYMSPEQAGGLSSVVDTRSDVYSLGVILYWLITGRLPHDTSGDTIQAVRRVATEEIVPPRQIQPTIDRGLSSILLKALSRDPNERYSTAAELADDLERHLHGDPVLAPAGPAYVLRRLLRKYRKVAVLAVLVFTILAGGVAAFIAATNRQARVALELANQADHARKLALAAEHNARRMLYVHRLEVAKSAIDELQFRRASALLDECPYEFRGWEWRLLHNRARPRDDSCAKIGPFEDPVSAMDFSSDGKLLAIATGRGTLSKTENPLITVCAAESGKVLAELRGHTDGIFALAFTPDAKQILSGGQDRTLRRWNAQTGQLLETVSDWKHPESASNEWKLFAIRFSPDARQVAFASHPQGLFISQVSAEISWESLLSTADHIQALAGEDDCLDFSPDGSRLAWSTRLWEGNVGHLFLVDPLAGTVLAHRQRPEEAPAYSVDFAPSGKRIITADLRDTLTLYSGDLSEVLGTFTQNEGTVRDAYFTADGQSVIGLVPGGMARVWNVQSRNAERALYPANNINASEMAISPDRQRLAIATTDPFMVRLWNLPDSLADETCLAQHMPKARDVAISPDGRLIATCGDDGTVQLHQWPERSLLWSEANELPYATAVAFSPNGKLLAAGWSIHPDVQPMPPYGRIVIFDVDTGQSMHSPLDVPGWIWQIRFDETGEKIVVADGVTPVHLPIRSGSAHVIQWSTGKYLRSVKLNEPRCRSAMLAKSGDILVTASEQTLALWDMSSGKLIAKRASEGGKNFLHAIKGGTQLVAGNGTSIEICDLTTLEVLQTFQQKRDMSPAGILSVVGDVAIHPSGKTLVSGSWIGTITVWDVESQEALLTLQENKRGIHRMAFSPDGRILFTAGHDGNVRCWETD